MATSPFYNYTGTLTITRVRIDRGGYGPDGTYWGRGMPLWRAEAQTDDRYYTTGDDAYLRAYDKAHAGDKLHRDNPKAKIKGWKSPRVSYRSVDNEHAVVCVNF